MPNSEAEHEAESSKAETPYFARIAKPYYSIPAQSGRRDDALLHLARRVRLEQPSLLLDYGCGQGRLLAALTECRTGAELNNLRYIGVDSDFVAMEKARSYFNAYLRKYDARATFVSAQDFHLDQFLVDQIVIVFAIHEFDPLNIDHLLSRLWRMVRRGGTLFIQDTSQPIFEEVEFIVFPPEHLASILQKAGAQVQVETIIAGRRNVAVFVIEARKRLDIDCDEAYALTDLSNSMRRAMHLGMLADCRMLMQKRTEVDSGADVNPDDLASLCHRIAVRARSFHQTLAFDEVHSQNQAYCVGCGSENVEVKFLGKTFKDPSELRVTCQQCNYDHHYVSDYPGWNSDYLATRNQFRCLDSGAEYPGEDVWRIAYALAGQSAEMRDMLWPFLERIPGVTPDKMQDVRKSIGVA